MHKNAKGFFSYSVIVTDILGRYTISDDGHPQKQLAYDVTDNCIAVIVTSVKNLFNNINIKSSKSI